MSARRWKFCVIGGLAVMRWGEVRLTLDADLSLFTGFGSEEVYSDALFSRFSGRLADARSYAMKYRVLMIYASNGKSLDISYAGLPIEQAIIRRATPFHFADDVVLPTCSAEDLFVMKVFAGRPKDLQDAESIAVRQDLNRMQILRRLKPLCEAKETPELLHEAMRILEKHR